MSFTAEGSCDFGGTHSDSEIFSAECAETNNGLTGVDQLLCQTLTDVVFVILRYVAEKDGGIFKSLYKFSSDSEPVAENKVTPGPLYCN